MDFCRSAHLSSSQLECREGFTMMVMKWIVGDQGKLTSLWHKVPSQVKQEHLVALLPLADNAPKLAASSATKFIRKSFS